MALTREELKNAHNNVMTIMENHIMSMVGCNRTTANLVANEILNLDMEAERLLSETEDDDGDWDALEDEIITGNHPFLEPWDI